MKSAILLFALIGGAVAAGPDKPAVQGKLLDTNEYLCVGCLFGANKYYYCFEADNRILIGYQKVPVLNWKDPESNDLEKLHGSWRQWKAEGPTVPLRYDAKDIWVTQPNGRQVKLKQDYNTDIFVNSNQCRSAVHKNN